MCTQMLQGVPRKAYYLATKVGRYEKDYPHMFDFSAQRVPESVQKSLQLLRLPQVDLIQVRSDHCVPSWHFHQILRGGV